MELVTVNVYFHSSDERCSQSANDLTQVPLVPQDRKIIHIIREAIRIRYSNRHLDVRAVDKVMHAVECVAIYNMGDRLNVNAPFSSIATSSMWINSGVLRVDLNDRIKFIHFQWEDTGMVFLVTNAMTYKEILVAIEQYGIATHRNEETRACYVNNTDCDIYVTPAADLKSNEVYVLSLKYIVPCDDEHP